MKNKWYHDKEPPKRFHLNGKTIGFRPQTQKLEQFLKHVSVTDLEVFKPLKELKIQYVIATKREIDTVSFVF